MRFVDVLCFLVHANPAGFVDVLDFWILGRFWKTLTTMKNNER